MKLPVKDPKRRRGGRSPQTGVLAFCEFRQVVERANTPIMNVPFEKLGEQ